MSHGQNADDGVASLYLLAQDAFGKVVVAPDGTVWNHHAFGKTCRAAGIVDHGEFVRTRFLVVVHVFGTEVLGEFGTEERVEVFSGIGQFVGSRNHERVVGYIDDTLQLRHLSGVDGGCHHVADKEELRLAMVYDMMNLFWQKFMQDGNSHGTIGQGSEKSHGPVGTVSSAEGNLVALDNTAVFV